MSVCRCGAPLAPSATRCLRCGARPLTGPASGTPAFRPAPVRTFVPMAMPVPAPAQPAMPAPSAPSQTPAWAGWAVGTAGVLIVGLLACVGFLALRPTSFTVAAPAPVSAPSTVTSVFPVSPAASAPTTRYSSSTDTPAISAQLLSEGADRDRAQVEALAGSWVPQLSAKRPGTVADGITYDATSILSHRNELSDRYGPVLVLNSSDWPVFRESDYWVVVAAQPFSTAAQANAWCSSQGIGADDCFAKRLTHSGDSAANTAPRS